MIELRAGRHVAADPATVYDLITDIRRMGEWSPENEGGQWCDARPWTWRSSNAAASCERPALCTHRTGLRSRHSRSRRRSGRWGDDGAGSVACVGVQHEDQAGAQ